MNLMVTASLLLMLFSSSIGEAFGSSLLRSHGSRKLQDEVEVPLVPDLAENWERIPDYPLDVGEAQGAMVDFDLILFGGFLPRFRDGAKETYMLNLKDHYDGLDVDWVQMDNCPVHPYWTHAAHAVKGSQLFFCGGYIYVDENDNFYASPERNECYLFDKTASSGNQWQPMPFLPEGRAGGGMVYVESMDRLVFALGAVRPDGHESVVDEPTVWMLDLSNPDADWVQLGDAPYTGNHVAAVDATDCAGNHHYFWLGGQSKYNETFGNLDSMYEYFPATDTWQQRADLPEGTGHATSSTIAYGCGFVIVGGAVDGGNPDAYSRTKNIFYYDIDNDQWSNLGDYARGIKTPVCGIYADKLYCSTGYIVEGWRSTITFPDIPTSTPTGALPAVPTSASTSSPGIPTSVPTGVPQEAPTGAPAPSPASLWDDALIRTVYRNGDFCPSAQMVVRVQLAGDDTPDVPATLKSETLGLDLAGVTNQWGRAIFSVSVSNPMPSGQYWVEGCAYDAGGTAYCASEEVEVVCPPDVTTSPTTTSTNLPSENPTGAPTPTVPTLEVPSSPPTLTPVPLWDSVQVDTNYRHGGFCPSAKVVVKVQIAGENTPGVPVTLRSETLGVDMTGVTNSQGKAIFFATLTDPMPTGQYWIEGCVYDAGGAAYCDSDQVEVLC